MAIYDFGHTPDGVFYYVMEHLEGLSLDRLILGDGPLPEPRLVHVLRQVAGALGEAHERGLVHRDVKPANVMLCVRGGVYDFVKVLDFGLAKQLQAGGDSELTAADVVVGTPHSLSPEAIRAADTVDAHLARFQRRVVQMLRSRVAKTMRSYAEIYESPMARMGIKQVAQRTKVYKDVPWYVRGQGFVYRDVRMRGDLASRNGGNRLRIKEDAFAD